MARIVRWLADRLGDWSSAAVGHRVVHGDPAATREPVGVLRGPRPGTARPAGPAYQPTTSNPTRPCSCCFPGCAGGLLRDGVSPGPSLGRRRLRPAARDLYEAGIRRYGFHGLSYAYIARAMRRLAPEVAAGRMVVAHLGNGAEAPAPPSALGRSIDLTMSFTALDGLAMGTPAAARSTRACCCTSARNSHEPRRAGRVAL